MIRVPPRFPLPFAAHRNFRTPTRSLYHVAGIRMVNQINGHRLNAIRPDQFGSFGLELWQLQNCDLERINIYRIAV
jgi:hypothetical protein